MQAFVQDLPTAPVHVVVSSRLAIYEQFVGRPLAAITHADAALSLADQLGLDPSTVASIDALAFRGSARCDLDDEGGLSDLEEAIRRATATGQGRRVGVLYNNLGIVLTRFRGPAAAAQVYEQGIAYCRTHGHPAAGLGLEVSRLEPLVSMGALDEVLSAGKRLASTLEAADDQQILADLRASTVRALLLQGRPGLTSPWLDRLATFGREMPGADDAANGLGAAASAFAALGRPDRAVSIFLGIVARPEIMSSTIAVSQAPTWIRALVGQGRLDLAEQITALVPTSGPLGEHVAIATDAALAEARGDFQAAVAGYQDAAARWHGFTMYVEEAFALLGQGRCLLVLDRPDEAVPRLHQAKDSFTRMGALPALTESQGLLADAT
jgi:hypothetical protein